MSFAVHAPSFPIIAKSQGGIQYSRGLVVTTALALFWSTGMALAQTQQGGAATSVAADTTLTFNIPAQPLAQALSAFSRQSGLQISQPAGITGNATSAALVGRFTAAQGLERLLRGSNISFRIGDNAAILSGPATSGGAPLSSSGATVLDTISVTGGGSIGQAQQDVYTGDKSTVVITPEAMDRFGRVTAGDLLKGQAGVQVGDNRNGGGLDVNIRGVQGQSRVAVTVDGTQQALDTYRGYAGTQQRSYIDPDLIGGVVINKGPSLAANASGAIGGTVAMQTIGVSDIVKESQSFGIRLKGELWDNGIEPQGPRSGVPRWEKYQATARDERGNLFDSEAKSGSVAGAYTSEHLDVVAAYARRNQGNYFAGKHGRDNYRIYTPQRRWDGTTYFYEENSVAKVYKEGEEVMNTSSDTESALLKATIRPNEEHTLDLGYRYFDGRFGEIMPSVIFRGGSGGNRLGQWPVGSMEINSFNARYAYDPADNDLINLKANAWLTDANSEQLNGGPLVPTSQKSDFDGDYGWARQHNQRFGIDVANRSEFDTALGGVKLDVSAAYLKEFIEPAKGVVITQDDLNNNRYLRDGERQEGNVAGQVTIEPTDNLSFRFGGRYMDFRSQDNNRASTPIYENKTFRNIVLKRGSSWLANARWFPDADGNYTDATNPLKNNGTATSYDDYSEVKISDLNYDGTTVYAPQTSQLVTGYKFGDKLVRKDGGFAPAFGATYNLDENSLIYVNYSEGLRMPGLFESTVGTLQVRQVANLRPEHSRNWEIGASTLTSDVLTGGDSLGLKLAYFNTNIEDYITRYYDPTGDGMMVMRNADSFKVSGLELQANYDEGRFFADASATYYFSAQTCDRDVAAQLRAAADEYTKTENTPDCTAGGFSGSYSNTQNPPKYSVNLTAGMRFFEETLTIGGRITHTSGPIDKLDKPWQKNVTAAQVFYRPVTVVDAFASYKLRDDAVLNVSAENLTNRYYLDPLAQSFMPAPGRTFRASLTMKF